MATIQGAFALSVISIALSGISLALLCLAMYFRHAKNRIVHHPNVELIHIAHPAIAEDVQAMVTRIATIAEVPAPEVFIFRADRPNAFIIATRKRPLLFLADELFEACDELGPEKGLSRLEWAICHEIAHIKESHGIVSGVTEVIGLAGHRLSVKCLVRLAERRRAPIEQQANLRAHTLLKKLGD